MPMSVDSFLAYYFRQHERRSSSRALSFDGARATSYEALDANAKYAWAIVVLGAAERDGRLTTTQVEVLRVYYLSLCNHHVALVRDRWGLDQCRRRTVHRGTAVPADETEIADLQSWVSWPKVAEWFGYQRHNRRAVKILKDAFRDGRRIVADELRAREGLDGAERAPVT